MTKRLGIFDVESIFNLSNTSHRATESRITVEKAIGIVMNQMTVNNYRERTVKDYALYFNQFVASQNIKYIDEIDIDSIYNWLNSMDVSAVTKQSRLKCLKAVLRRFKYNGWIDTEFYKNIVVRVDRKVKKGSNPSDLAILISLIDTSTFVGYRDVCAIILLYKSGIRSRTLSYLEERHIDFDNLCLNLSADIMKNRQSLKLPIDKMLADSLKQLIEMNNKIRAHYGEKNSYIFITNKGRCIKMDETSNAITKQLYKYGKKFGLEDINCHSIRRAYAKSLLDKNVSVALISKALGHSDLETTTRYLDLDVNEVADALRDYL